MGRNNYKETSFNYNFETPRRLGALFVVIILVVIGISKIDLNEVEFPDNVNHSLLYVENTHDSKGLHDGAFGDIVLYKLSDNKRYLLTNDTYYDYNPTYSGSLNLILFASERKVSNATGLTSRSDLYKINLIDETLEPFAKSGKVDNILNDRYYPLFNNAGSEVIWIQINPEKTSRRMIVLSNPQLTTEDTIYNRLRDQYNIRWSQNDSLLYFTSYSILNRVMRSNSFSSINIFDKSLKRIYSHENYFLDLKDVVGDVAVLVEESVSDYRERKLTIYDLSKNYVIKNIDTKEIGFSDITYAAIMDESNIYLVGVDKDGYDIYLFNVETNQLNKITDDGEPKGALTYLK